MPAVECTVPLCRCLLSSWQDVLHHSRMPATWHRLAALPVDALPLWYCLCSPFIHRQVTWREELAYKRSMGYL